MIDMWNAVVIGVGCLILGAVLGWSRERRRAVAAALSAFAVGLALHSVYLHERLRHRWRLPWDHEER
jgi:hypothetical protein